MDFIIIKDAIMSTSNLKILYNFLVICLICLEHPIGWGVIGGEGNNMSNIYENILSGLQEAIDDSVAEKKTLKRRMVVIVPVKEYSSKEVKKLGIIQECHENNDLTKKFPFVQVE